MTCDEGWVLLSFSFKIDLILRVCQIMQKTEFPSGVCVQPSHEICILSFILVAEQQTDSDFNSVTKPVNWDNR